MDSKKGLLFVSLFLLVFSAVAFAAPDVNILSPQSGESYSVGTTITIDFNVSDADNNRLLVDINYSALSTNGSGTVIAHDVNLTSAFCTDQTWNDLPSNCHYSWSTVDVPAGCHTISGSGTLTTTACDYYILISIDNSASVDFNSGSSYITITKTSDLNVNISPIGTLINNSTTFADMTMHGISGQGNLIGTAIGITLAVLFFIALVITVIKITPTLVSKMKRLNH